MKPGPTINIEQINKILEQVLRYFADHSEKLEEEGILRISGDTAQQLKVLSNLGKKPSASLLDKGNIKILSSGAVDVSHNIIGVLKKAINPVRFDQETLDIFKRLADEKPIEDPHEIIDELIRNQKMDAARLLHNLLHLGTLIAKKHTENKMTALNVAVVLNPQLANITGDIMLGFNPISQRNVEKIISDSMSSDSLLNKPFNLQTYRDRHEKQAKLPQSPTDTESTSPVSSPEISSKRPREVVTVANTDSPEQHKKTKAFLQSLPQDKLTKGIKKLGELQKAKGSTPISTPKQKPKGRGG